jgi:hypothetical protein
VAVAVDHGVFQAGVYLFGAMHHRHGFSPCRFLYNRFEAEPSNVSEMRESGSQPISDNDSPSNNRHDRSSKQHDTT